MELLYAPLPKDTKVLSLYDLNLRRDGDEKVMDSQTKDGTTLAFLNRHLEHLASLNSPHFQQLQRRSKIVLAVTLPFYAMWPSMLEQLDIMISQQMMIDNVTWFQSFTKLVSLPLAYNLVRLFSNTRCYKSSNFLSHILQADTMLRPNLERERERLHALQAKKSGRDDAVLEDQLKQFDKMVDGIGVHCLAEDVLAQLPMERAYVSQEWTWLSMQALRTISKKYDVPMPALYKEYIKTKEKVGLCQRLSHQ